MKRHLQLIALAAFLVLLPYVRGMRYPFVFDDHAVIEDNAFLEDADAWFATLTGRTLFDKRIYDSGRPAVILSYLFDYTLWGKKPLGYRLTNWVLHAIAVGLIYVLIWRLASSQWVAFSAALLFGLHPVLIEAVHSPAFREDPLLTAGILGILLSARHVGWAFFLLLLTLGAKESGVVAIPMLWWLWLCFPEQRPTRVARQLITVLGGLLTLWFLAIWIISGTLQALSVETKQPPLPFPLNLWTAPWLFVRLWRFLLWPHPLRADHVIDPVNGWWDPRFWAGLTVVVLTVVAAMQLRTRAPLVAFALGWMCLAFVPVSNLIPLHNPFAERYAYLPCIGFATILAWAASRIPQTYWRAVAVVSVAALYAYGISVPLRAWRDDFSLWQRVLLYEPRSAKAWVWTGLELKRQGLREEALAHFRRAQELDPAMSAPLVNTAIMLGEEGRLHEAASLLRKAAQRWPDEAEIWWNLAVCLHLQGRDDEALEAARRARSAAPYFLPVRRMFSEDVDQ